MWRSKAAQLAGLQTGTLIEFLEQLGVHEGVEMVHPYLDREMLDFAFRTPPQLVGTLMNKKRLLSRAMARRFPDAVWERPKTPSPDPFVAKSLQSIPDRLGPASGWRLPALLPLDAERRDLLRRVGAREPLEFPSLAWDLVCQEFWLRRHFSEESFAGETRGRAAVA
jgi:hypothetical protein